MALPGTAGAEWATALLLWAVVAAVLGEPLRHFAGRWVTTWRQPEPIERFVLDLYLGGAVLYVLAAVPFGLFVAPVVLGLPVVAAVIVLALVARARRAGATPDLLVGALGRLVRPTYLVVLLSAFALYVLELVVALPVGTGNTFDSGLLTTYTALLLQHHAIPLSFQPYAAPAILYPQGTTVWLGWAQVTWGLPPARASLLVTPLFFALAPLGAFVFGHRWFGTERAGLAFALTIAWLAPWTRGLVGGSNDFVFAFPLVLLLAGQAAAWFRTPLLSAGNAVGFGLLVGYSAAMNPVGAEWLVLTVLIGTVAAGPTRLRALISRLGRWGLAAGASLLGVVPSLYVLVLGYASPGFVPGAAAAPAGSPNGITLAQLLGSIDPFLFRPQDVQLSPVPELRFELAVLIVIGLGLLVLARPGSALERYLAGFRRFALVAGVVITGLLGVLLLASASVPFAVAVAAITSEGELSAWVLTLYAFVAALPLVLALERFVGWLDSLRPAPPTTARPVRRRAVGVAPRLDPTRAIVPLAVALLIVVPGVVLTPTALPPVLATLYGDFGRVSADDLQLLEYAGTHLPPGARVLIAPGSAGDFLPGYAPNVVLLYPLIPGFPWTNRSYNLVVAELSNATMDARGRAALMALDVEFVVVTGNNTVLWPAFSPLPLLADPGTFPLLQSYGSAYLFGVGAGA